MHGTQTDLQKPECGWRRPFLLETTFGDNSMLKIFSCVFLGGEGITIQCTSAQPEDITKYQYNKICGSILCPKYFIYSPKLTN